MELTIGVSADFHALGRAVTEPVERALRQAPAHIGYRYFEASGMNASGKSFVQAQDIRGLDGIVLLGYPVPEDALDETTQVAAIGRWGVGYDTLHVPSLTQNGCLLAITPDGVRRPVAEAVLTFMLALAKQLLPKDRIARSGDWERRNEPRAVGLTGKTIGSVGLGNIGADLFRLLAPFRLGRLLAHDPYGDPGTAAELNVELVSLEELLSESDFVSLSCPLNAETHHLMNAERLAMMKSTAYLINTARGPVVDQDALVDALRRGVIAGAGLDVQVPEPLPADDPLTELDNVILAPHTLAWTDELYALNGEGAVRNVLSVLTGGMPQAVVNPEVADNPVFQERLARFKAAAQA